MVSPIFVPEKARLIFGNELLAKLMDDYEDGKRYKVKQHTVRAVMAVASSKMVGLPFSWSRPEEITNAAEVFAGYLMLDALVGNQDRHHENWGLILLPDKSVFLAPTFDHASSLGRNESDETRQDRLATKDKNRTVAAYVGRAKSAMYLASSSPKPLTTLGAFREAAKIRPHAAAYWKERLASVDLNEFSAILAEIPDSEITEPARKFAYRMLEINRDRILT